MITWDPMGSHGIPWDPMGSRDPPRPTRENNDENDDENDNDDENGNTVTPPIAHGDPPYKNIVFSITLKAPLKK